MGTNIDRVKLVALEFIGGLSFLLCIFTIPFAWLFIQYDFIKSGKKRLNELYVIFWLDTLHNNKVVELKQKLGVSLMNEDSGREAHTKRFFI